MTRASSRLAQLAGIIFRCCMSQEALANGTGGGSGDGGEDEVQRLQAEANMPLEDLMRMAYGASAEGGGSISGFDSRSGSDMAEDDELDLDSDGDVGGSDAGGEGAGDGDTPSAVRQHPAMGKSSDNGKRDPGGRGAAAGEKAGGNAASATNSNGRHDGE